MTDPGVEKVRQRHPDIPQGSLPGTKPVRVTKTGWCMDEVKYRDLDRHDYANHLHSSCRWPQTCPCEGHAKENSQ